MSGPTSITIEQPLGDNPEIDALDEAGQRLALSSFVVTGAVRCSFLWPLHDRDFERGCLELLVKIAPAIGSRLSTASAVGRTIPRVRFERGTASSPPRCSGPAGRSRSSRGSASP
jgi:hypothetical protein